MDMGDEFYMVVRPHSMIDSSQRASHMLKEANDPDLGIPFLDFILDYNASMDPVGELIEAIQEEQQASRKRGDDLVVVASVCGTADDTQELALQTRMFEESGEWFFRAMRRRLNTVRNYWPCK